MAVTIQGISVPFTPIGRAEGPASVHHHEVTGKASFDRVFQRELQEITFTQHAQKRLQSRNIRLSENDLQLLKQAMALAQQKGGNDSLILLRNLALIVNVNTNTVVTAIGPESIRDRVFTNIDTAVVAA